MKYAGFTLSHIARRCEMSVGQVRDYMYFGRQAQSIDVFDRVADNLHVPGKMLAISSRPGRGMTRIAQVMLRPLMRMTNRKPLTYWQ